MTEQFERLPAPLDPEERAAFDVLTPLQKIEAILATSDEALSPERAMELAGLDTAKIYEDEEAMAQLRTFFSPKNSGLQQAQKGKFSIAVEKREMIFEKLNITSRIVENVMNETVVAEGKFTDSPKGESAYQTPYLKETVEMVTGERISALPPSEAPDLYQFGDTWTKQHEEKDEAMSLRYQEALKGKKVLDLGCGAQALGYKLANYCQAESYTGVEKNFAKRAARKLHQVSKSGIPYELVQADLRSYLENPDVRANVVIFTGIDPTLVPAQDWDAILNNLVRVVGNDGLLLIGGGVGIPWDKINQRFEPRDDSFMQVKK